MRLRPFRVNPGVTVLGEKADSVANQTNRRFSRRHFLKAGGQMAAGTTLLAAFPPAAVLAVDPVDCPMTGPIVPALAGFDRLMQSLVMDHGIPGASLAMARRGRVIYARGFGYGDRELREAVQPESLFRIASISKPITSAAIMQLVERGRLKLSDHPFKILDMNPFLQGEAKVDPRLEQITIHQVLCHTGGFDNEKGYNPMFRPEQIAKAMGLNGLPTQNETIRFMMGRPLDFDPGTKFAYSNFGYCMLGRVIEKLTGESYVEYVQKEILKPLRISRMRLGRSLLRLRAPGEVRYYPPYQSLSHNVFGEPDSLWCYGGFNLEAMDSHGGWIATAADLVRFGSSLDDPAHCPILKPASIKELFARPPETGYRTDGKPTGEFYASGWRVRVQDGKTDAWHDGGLDGTNSLLFRRHDGLTWAALFNSSENEKKEAPNKLITERFDRVADAVKEWPIGVEPEPSNSL